MVRKFKDKIHVKKIKTTLLSYSTQLHHQLAWHKIIILLYKEIVNIKKFIQGKTRENVNKTRKITLQNQTKVI